MNRLPQDFFKYDAVTVARRLLGKTLVRLFSDGTIKQYTITETEAYSGEEDRACHASKGRTSRTEIMYAEGGCVYVYLIYGMYWMLNFVTGEMDCPQAVLIRGVDTIVGSGRVGRELGIDKTFYGEDLCSSQRIFVLDAPECNQYTTAPRVGIDYAGDEWKSKPWRFILNR